MDYKLKIVHILNMLLTLFLTLTRATLQPSRAHWNHDCTFKESLYSTHPYLTYSNKKSSWPVMTKFSIHGYREKIGILCITVQVLWRRAALNIHSHSMPVNAIWTGLPPPQNPKWVTTQHTISSRRGDSMPFGNCFPSLDKGFGSLPHFVSSTFF